MKVIKSVKITSANNYGWIVDSSEAMKALDMWIEAVGEENALEDIARALSTDDLKENIEWVARQWGFGEELEDIEDAWDKYEYAKEVMGVSELLTNLSQAIGYDELSEDMAYIFRMNDFREWKSDYEDDNEIESSRRITSSVNDDKFDMVEELCNRAIKAMGGDRDAMFYNSHLNDNGFVIKGKYIDKIDKDKFGSWGADRSVANDLWIEVCKSLGMDKLLNITKATDRKNYQMEVEWTGNALMSSRRPIKSSMYDVIIKDLDTEEILVDDGPWYTYDDANDFGKQKVKEFESEGRNVIKEIKGYHSINVHSSRKITSSRRPIKSSTSIKEYAGFKIDDSVKINSPKRGPYKNGKTGIVVGFYKRYDGEILISVQLDEGGLMDFSEDELENLGDSGYHITYLDSSRRPIKSGRRQEVSNKDFINKLKSMKSKGWSTSVVGYYENDLDTDEQRLYVSGGEYTFTNNDNERQKLSRQIMALNGGEGIGYKKRNFEDVINSSRRPVKSSRLIKSANGSWEYQGDDMDEVEEKIGDIGISFTEPLLLADDGTLYTRAGFDQWLKYLEREEGDNWSDAYELYHRDTDEEFIEMCQDDFFQHDFGYTLTIYSEGLKSIAESVAEEIPSNEAPFAIPSGFAFNLYAEEEEPSGFNSYWIDDMPLNSESFIWGINPKLGNRFDVAIDPDCLWNGTENIQSNKIQSKRLIKSGTSNFGSNDDVFGYSFPLVAYIAENHIYDEETGTETEERDYDADDWEYEDAIDNAKALADEMNIPQYDDYSEPYLCYEPFMIKFRDGYYEGLWIEVKEGTDETNYDSDGEYTGEWVPFTEEQMNKYADKLNEYFDKLCSDYGWQKLGVTARFSNGETMYHKL